MDAILEFLSTCIMGGSSRKETYPKATTLRKILRANRNRNQGSVKQGFGLDSSSLFVGGVFWQMSGSWA